MAQGAEPSITLKAGGLARVVQPRWLGQGGASRSAPGSSPSQLAGKGLSPARPLMPCGLHAAALCRAPVHPSIHPHERLNPDAAATTDYDVYTGSHKSPGGA